MTVAQRHTTKMSEFACRTSDTCKSQNYFCNPMTLLIQLLRKCNSSNKELSFTNSPGPCKYLASRTKHSPPSIFHISKLRKIYLTD